MGCPPAPSSLRERASELRRGRAYALSVLFCINLFNYADRYVPAAVLPLLLADESMGITNTLAGIPQGAFTLVYMAVSPLVGHVVDVLGWKRTRVLAVGVVVWSLATAATALSTDFWSFLIARALVGVGEGTYVTVAPDLISDLFPPHRRGLALTLFSCAIPVGVALGYGIGGAVGSALGWRAAFLVLGLPGIIVAFACLTIHDPGRGVFDGGARSGFGAGASGGDRDALPWKDFLQQLVRNRVYMANLAGYILVVYALGAMAYWFPKFLVSERGVELAVATLIIGAGLMVGGLAGAFGGGFLAHWLQKRDAVRQPNFFVQGAAVGISVGFISLSLIFTELATIAVLFVVAELFLFGYQGPTMALCTNSVNSSVRARAVAMYQLLSHLLGDAVSPIVLGAMADSTGLTLAIWINLVPPIAIAAVIWLVAWRVTKESSYSADYGRVSQTLDFVNALALDSSDSESDAWGVGGESVSLEESDDDDGLLRL
jgi:MFS transporter, Spinster family, sphingosine-1-phosphate transporter